MFVEFAWQGGRGTWCRDGGPTQAGGRRKMLLVKYSSSTISSYLMLLLPGGFGRGRSWAFSLI